MVCSFLDSTNNKCNLGSVDDKGNLTVNPLDKELCDLKPENIPRHDCNKFKCWIELKEMELRT